MKRKSKAGRRVPAIEKIPAEPPPPAEPVVPISLAEQVHKQDLDRQMKLEAKRAAKMREVADLRWMIATTQHVTDKGEPLDFEAWPFLVEIYKSEAQDLVCCGSAGYGKTQFGICDAAAKAALGLGVFWIFDSLPKRNKIVLGVIDPTFERVPFYKGMLQSAKQRGAEVDSANYKHFGDGFINFINANAEAEFSSHHGDCKTTDEHQLCDIVLLKKASNRLTGSDYRFNLDMGNPRGVGTEENQNIDWQFKISDQRQWHIPCPTCGQWQVLGWWSHFIEEVKNEYGAIMEVRIRDENWDPDGPMEPRPICINCAMPMVRLHREGEWRAMNPGKRRHGYQLSSLYNPTINMSEMFSEYKGCLHDPNLMRDFINDKLGIPYNTSGSNITEAMMENASTGRAAGVAPYAMKPANDIEWRDLDAT